MDTKKIIKKLKRGNYEMRSCWNCNSAHERLKNHELIWCYECGNYYYKGKKITRRIFRYFRNEPKLKKIKKSVQKTEPNFIERIKRLFRRKK